MANSPTLARSAVATLSSIIIALGMFAVTAAVLVSIGGFIAYLVFAGAPPRHSPATQILITAGIGASFGSAIWAGRRWYARMIG